METVELLLPCPGRETAQEHPGGNRGRKECALVVCKAASLLFVMFDLNSDEDDSDEDDTTQEEPLRSEVAMPPQEEEVALLPGDATKREYNSLSPRFPGTIAGMPFRSAKAPSRKSRRKSALRDSSSGPWQEKQFRDKTGRTSRL